MSRAYYLKNREKILAQQKEYYKEHAEKRKVKTAEWAKANRERVRLSQARYRERHPERNWGCQYLPRYGITREMYLAQLVLQGGRCAICDCDILEGKRRPCVDHNHATTMLRGLLCHFCNIGQFFEIPLLLERAIKYYKSGGVWGYVEGAPYGD